MLQSPAQIVMERIEALGGVSDEPGRLTRTFGSSAMRMANKLVGGWMRQAGMSVHQDAIGNLIGHYPANGPKGHRPQDEVLILGSHLDTVRDAGKFDGPLGVLTAIACVQRLKETEFKLPFAIKVVGFADEEGVRFQSTYLGSKAMAGTLNRHDLKRCDRHGISVAQAIRDFGCDPDALPSARLACRGVLGYLEVHIEQGPVLEAKNLAVGVVSAIAGQSRLRITFTGKAGHAGTTPMPLRRDALCAASEFVLAVEALARKRTGLVATVGEIAALPGASNVIPGQARLSLDVRHAKDDVREKACSELQARGRTIAAKRQMAFASQTVHEAAAVECDPHLSALLARVVKKRQPAVRWLPSGAGHDAAAMAAIAPVAMLFVRCKDGLSHHPAESVSRSDVAVAIAVVEDFVKSLALQ